MPVVSSDWMWPSDWLHARVARGVVRDGDTLRLARLTPGGKPETQQVAVSEWRKGHPQRDRLEREVKKGAVLVAGLPPHRLLSRRLVSPLRDARKANEIWPTLFDAAIPYPLEQCRVAFLPLGRDGEGSACLAAGIRDSDVDEVLAEWAELGLAPDLLIPEPLALCGPGVSRVWLGTSRTVWSLWDHGTFRGLGGARVRESHDKTFARQRAALEVDTAPPTVGPDADVEPEILEIQLARCARRPDPYAVNLLTEAQAPLRIRNRWDRAQRRVRGLGGFTLLLLFLLPLFLPHLVWMRAEQTERELLRTFEEMTGRAPPPAGQVAVRARQILESGRERFRQTLDTLESPRVSMDLAELLERARARGILLEAVEVREDRFRVLAKGDSEDVSAWAGELSLSGWTCGEPQEEDQGWTVEGRR